MTKWINPIWWKFYHKAGTIYQVHSPFLFDFGVHLWSQVASRIKHTKGHAPNDDRPLEVWMQYICEYYQVSQLILPADNIVPSFLNGKKSMHQFDIISNNGVQFTQYRNNEAPDPYKKSNDKPVFAMLGVFGTSTLRKIDLSELMTQNDSCVILCPEIHKNHNQYLQWKKIISHSEFNFSVELYNFGLLFKHPVNERPEHITLISWRLKPWKMKIL